MSGFTLMSIWHSLIKYRFSMSTAQCCYVRFIRNLTFLSFVSHTQRTENNKTHKTHLVDKMQLLIVKVGDTYSNHRDLKV
jgi:hypothetical protein